VLIPVLTICVAASGLTTAAATPAHVAASIIVASVVAAPVAGSTSPAEDPPAQVTPKKKPKDPAKPKKKKSPNSDTPAPDEPVNPDAVDTGTPTHGVRFVWKQHPSLRFGSVLRLDFEAKVQEDAHWSYPGAQDPNVKGPLETFDLHRNRIGVQGALFKRIEFEIERELTEKELSEKDLAEGLTPHSQWKDVNVNVSYLKNAQIQVGKFKIPFGLDELTGVTHNDFVYRSLGASYLAPARDIGAMVHGRFFKRGLSYWAGVFKHDGDNARSKKIQGGDQTFAVRVTGTPFRRAALPGLTPVEIGSAFTVSALADDSFRPNGLRGRTVLTQDTFNTLVYVKGERRRWEADIDWTWGPASARAEYTLVRDDRLRQGLGDDDLPDARGRAWYVSGTWLVTGDRKTRPVKPENDFLRGGIGAVELAARYERLWFDSAGGTDEPFRNPRAETILPSGDRVLTLGVNWTLNRFMKLQFNGIREHVEDPERNPVPNGAAFWSRVLRLQFVL
jgi:phosphate-selective porin OprO/OprP